uniref:DRBM domain-containing protein n=1 Tax=Plectus sambesii TaxID=2011161 RepID=A0A914VW44_9BILA
MAADERYRNKTILAPMVRAGQLPLRLLSLDYGADLVYTEEIVDMKMTQCTRTVNDKLQTIDFGFPGDDPVLRICPSKERDKIVFQMGTNDADRALQVAKFVENDVGSIDVNMGCPKPFSIHCGMGAALLTQLDKATQILTTLVQGSKIPITCKVRLLDTLPETLHMVKELEKCGISAIGVHGRTRDERPQHPNRNEEIREVVRALSIPVIANGGSSIIHTYDDIAKFRSATGCDSVMIARRALSTPSIFRKEGILPMEEEIRNFLHFAIDYEAPFTNAKYVLQRILGGEQEFDPRGRATVRAVNVEELCAAWNMTEKFQEVKNSQSRATLKRKVDDVEIIDLSFPPKRLRSKDGTSPKGVLHTHCCTTGMGKPVYHSTFRDEDKRYTAVVDIDGAKYSSRVGQPNKKMAEQVAALVALHSMNLRHLLSGTWED